MSKQSDVMKEVPSFIERLEKAKSEDEIANACKVMKDIVDQVFNKTAGRRDPKTMAAIRKAVDERFPVQHVDGEVASNFPYYFTSTKRGLVKRLEHLASKYLMDEQNRKAKQSNTEVLDQTVEPISEAKDISLESFGLSEEEFKKVKQAIGESDIKEWVKQAIMQRANAINNKKVAMDEDLSEVPSEILMNGKKYRTNPIAARELVSRAVRVVKLWNHDHPDQKWCITNKLIGELTGVTVKAIAKAVEGMELETYNKSHGLTPVVNRMVKGSVGEASQVMSLASVTGVEGTEENYR